MHEDGGLIINEDTNKKYNNIVEKTVIHIK